MLNAIDYSSARYPVRTNFAETHNRFWDRLASRCMIKQCAESRYRKGN